MGEETLGDREGLNVLLSTKMNNPRVTQHPKVSRPDRTRNSEDRGMVGSQIMHPPYLSTTFFYRHSK